MRKFKLVVKNQLANAISIAFPSLAREIETGKNPTKYAWLKKQIIDGRKARSTKISDFDQLQEAHFDYWRGDLGTKFYGAYPSRFEDWFLGEHAILITELERLIQTGSGINRIIEIGCGDGQVLNYLSCKLSGIKNAVGIDINKEIIQENNKKYKDNSKLEFIAIDGREGIRANLQDKTLILSYGGVLEYFSEQSVADIFRLIQSESRNCAIAVVEPIAPDHNLVTTLNSIPFGREKSFSHNHEYLLRETGFKIFFEGERFIEDRWKIVIAKTS
jgi:SAM-dependent methyltransferase